MPEEHQPPAKSLALEPLDFRSLTSDVARRSNDGGAMLPLDPAGLWVGDAKLERYGAAFLEVICGGASSAPA